MYDVTVEVRFLKSVSMEFYWRFHSTKFANVLKREWKSFMRFEESFIPMKLHWHNYLIFSLVNTCVMKLALRQTSKNREGYVFEFTWISHKFHVPKKGDCGANFMDTFQQQKRLIKG
jgi:hypothetical protein